ncbi:hypothetical protein ACYOEI_06310 [Singulisphaera rosea]
MNTRKLIVATLVLINAGYLAFSLGSTFVTADEVRQIPAGIAHWKAGSFSLANDSPPLARLIATLPSLLVRVNFAPYDLKTTEILLDSSLRDREEAFGSQFAIANPKYLGMIQAARWTNFAWWLVGAWVIGRWALERYGRAAMIVALTLWSASPAVLAQEHSANGALPSAVSCALATYVFRRYLKAPSLKLSLAVGILFGVAQLVDFMSLVLAIVWPLMAIAFRFGAAEPSPKWPRIFTLGGQFAGILLVSLWVVNLGYGFQGIGTSLDDFDFMSRSLGADPKSDRPPSGGEPTGNRFRGTWVGRQPVPLPEDYLMGLDRRWHEIKESNGRAFEDGRPTERNPLSTLGAEIPIGLGVMILWSFGLLALRHPRNTRCPEELALWIFPLVAVALTAPSVKVLSPEASLILSTPFVAIGVSKLGYFFRPGHRISGIVVAFLVAWVIIGGLATFPHPRSYLNEAALNSGNLAARMRFGPREGGPDLIPLKEWLGAHPGVSLRGMAVRNPLGPEVTKLPVPLPQADPKPPGTTTGPIFAARKNWPRTGVYALDPANLADPRYSYFNEISPMARVRSSTYLYRIGPEEADRLRLDRGLPRLERSSPGAVPEKPTILYRTFLDSRGEASHYTLSEPAGYRAEEKTSYPLLLFLHGYGDRGESGRQYIAVGVPAILKSLEDEFDTFVLCPQGRSGSWEIDGDDARKAIELLDAIGGMYRVDPNRIYLSGISSGGRGVWEFAAHFPERWAAIVPVASSAQPDQARAIARIACWCFHNSHDIGSPPSSPRAMIAGLRRAGGSPRYTEFLGMDHNCWDRAYRLPQLYDWLFQQRRP